MVLQAPRENIKMVNYNVAGIPPVVTAREIETALKKRYPASQITYNDDQMLPALRAHAVMKVLMIVMPEKNGDGIRNIIPSKRSSMCSKKICWNNLNARNDLPFW